MSDSRREAVPEGNGAVGGDRNEGDRSLLPFLESSFDSASMPLAHLDCQKNFLRVNLAYARTLGRTPAFFRGRNLAELFPHPENEAIFERVCARGEPHTVEAQPFEFDDHPEVGRTHWDWTITPVKDGRGHVMGVVLGLQNVSERINAIEALTATEINLRRELAENSLLLEEVHHRVKNNLQIVASLLSLQKSRHAHPDLAGVLDDVGNRVRAMALIHEVLHSSGKLAELDLPAYVDRLLAAIVHSLAPERKRLDLDLRKDVSVPLLSLDQAAPCGLILSELVSNAIKHAFPDRRAGRIEVRVATEADHLSLEVADDGIGLPNPDVRRAESLGLKLVQVLTRQLDGELTVTADPGTRFCVRWPAPAAR